MNPQYIALFFGVWFVLVTLICLAVGAFERHVHAKECGHRTTQFTRKTG